MFTNPNQGAKPPLQNSSFSRNPQGNYKPTGPVYTFGAPNNQKKTTRGVGGDWGDDDTESSSNFQPKNTTNQGDQPKKGFGFLQKSEDKKTQKIVEKTIKEENQ